MTEVLKIIDLPLNILQGVPTLLLDFGNLRRRRKNGDSLVFWRIESLLGKQFAGDRYVHLRDPFGNISL